jgi:hypothetical protein
MFSPKQHSTIFGQAWTSWKSVERSLTPRFSAVLSLG